MAQLVQDTAPMDMFGQRRTDKVEGGTLDKRFIVSPFSVLDARRGRWQDRKREWIRIGVKGEEGRQDIVASRDAVPGGGGPRSARRLAPKDAGRCFGQEGVNVAADKGYSYAAGENGVLDEGTQRSLGVYAAPGGVVVRRNLGTPMEAGLAFGEDDGGNRSVAGTSVFDPVLCECMYRWFAPKGGKILDPFAGESTKGIVAGYLDYSYLGVELRPEQVKANYRQAGVVQAKALADNETMTPPNWVQGDSSKLGEVLDEHDPFSNGYDFVWTSPPYYDLEIYSESEKDGSAIETYEKFMVWYEDIFRQVVARLKDNRFLAVKVGEIRDEKGEYRNFEADNIACFKRLGLRYYNRIVLVTAVGSLPVRISSQFPTYRKVGNTHQMIYIFYKGDNFKRIPDELGILPKEDVLEKGDLAEAITAERNAAVPKPPQETGDLVNAKISG